MRIAKRALLVVDVQKDFCPGGSLPVPDANAIVPVINELRERVHFDGGVYFSKCWHPPGHCSFASANPPAKPYDTINRNGVAVTVWPDHCVQGSPGADFPDGLLVKDDAVIVLKADTLERDSYSAFFDNSGTTETSLRTELEKRGVRTLYICGLALDICVYNTVLDSCKLGFQTFVVNDGCVSIDLLPEKLLAFSVLRKRWSYEYWP